MKVTKGYIFKKVLFFCFWEWLYAWWLQKSKLCVFSCCRRITGCRFIWREAVPMLCSTDQRWCWLSSVRTFTKFFLILTNGFHSESLQSEAHTFKKHQDHAGSVHVSLGANTDPCGRYSKGGGGGGEGGGGGWLCSVSLLRCRLCGVWAGEGSIPSEEVMTLLLFPPGQF